MIVDASVILMAFLTDEEGHLEARALIHAHAAGAAHLDAPDLLRHEITNTLIKAVRQQRLSKETAQEILDIFESLDISFHAVSISDSFKLADRYGRSAYDTAYLALAEALDTALITGDRRFYNAVHPQVERVVWIGDYQSPVAPTP